MDPEQRNEYEELIQENKKLLQSIDALRFELEKVNNDMVQLENKLSVLFRSGIDLNSTFCEDGSPKIKRTASQAGTCQTRESTLRFGTSIERGIYFQTPFSIFL